MDLHVVGESPRESRAAPRNRFPDEFSVSCFPMVDSERSGWKVSRSVDRLAERQKRNGS